MTLKTKSIWLAAGQIVSALLLLPVFLCWAPWESAQTRADALLSYPGHVIPPQWRAVTMDHGTIHEWKLGTVSQNPIGFGACTLLLVSILVWLFWSIWFTARLKRRDDGRHHQTPAP